VFASIVYICTFITHVYSFFILLFVFIFDGCIRGFNFDHIGSFSNCTICLSYSVGSWISYLKAYNHVIGNPSLIYNLSPPKIPHNSTLSNAQRYKLLVMVKLLLCHRYPWIMCYLYGMALQFNVNK